MDPTPPAPSPSDDEPELPEHWRFAPTPTPVAMDLEPRMYPPEPDRRICSVCGKPLGDDKVEICWRPDRSFHVRCHDWRAAHFPVALVGDLRQLYRALAKLRPHLASTGVALAKLQATWPASGADTVLAARRARNELRDVIERLQIMRRLYAIND